jgi:flagellar protein FlaI
VDDTKPNSKLHKKPTLDISHIEKSIDAMNDDKNDKKLKSQPQQAVKSETGHKAYSQEKTIESLKEQVPPKNNLNPENKQTKNLNHYPLIDIKPPTFYKKDPVLPQIKLETPKPQHHQNTQPLPFKPMKKKAQSTQEQHKNQKSPRTQRFKKQKYHNLEYPHKNPNQRKPKNDITSFSSTTKDRSSINSIKNKHPTIPKKSFFHLPVLPTLNNKKRLEEKPTTTKTKPSISALHDPSTKTSSTINKDVLPNTPEANTPTKKPFSPKETGGKLKNKEKKSLFKIKKFTKSQKLSQNKDKKTTLIPQTTKYSSTPPQSHPELHESVQQLSSDESTWLDQKIYETKNKDVSQNDHLKQLQQDGEEKASKTHLHEEIKRLEKDTIQPKTNYFYSEQNATSPKLQTDLQKDKSKSLPKIPQKNQTTKVNIPFTYQNQKQKNVKELLDLPEQTRQQTHFTNEISPDSIQSETEPLKGKLPDINQIKNLLLKDLGYNEGSCEKLDFYALIEPFAYVEIIKEKDTLDKRYVLIEIDLTDQEQAILNFIHESLNNINVDAKELEEKGDRVYLKDQVEQIIEDYMIDLDDIVKRKIIFYIEKQFLGLEKLEVLMRDPNIEDISCDGARVPIFLYHRHYGSLRSNVEFENEEELASFVIKLAQKCGKHISIAEPMLDATMPDGSRIQMTLSSEITTKGSTFTIRKFMQDPFSPPDLIEFNTMSAEMVAYIWMAVENGINALIAGGTAAGKTSTLNALALFIPRESKIVSIEETREINLPHPNWIPGVSRSGFGEVVGNKIIGEIDLYDLMKAALRQRPEYILVGEIRGKEAYVLFQAMATGHTTYSTVHADSAQSLIHRLEGKPINIPRIMLQALDVVCIQIISRVKNKRARRCKQIIEIIDIDPTTKEILTNEVFHWDPIEDKFIYSGKSSILERIRAEKDLSRDQMTKELHDRAHLLGWMNEQNIREFKKVATIVAQYMDDSRQIMNKIG